MTALTKTVRIAILVETDTRQAAELVNALTIIIGVLMAVASWLKPAVIFAVDLIEAAHFTVKVLAICFNALAFGLGVRL